MRKNRLKLVVWMSAALLGGLLSASCGGDSADEAVAWQIVHEELPGALLSLWGSAADDIWSVGGDAGDGMGPMVLHFDGKQWERLFTGVEGDLWWVTGFANGAVFMGGADGLILRYERGGFERMPTPGSNTVFGIWGSSPNDLWAVGGAGATPSGGFAWRYDGSTWKAAEGLPESLAASSTLFKVWGRAADDVWIVGTDGVLVHSDGKAFELVQSPSARTLFTVSGDADRAIAVGGSVSGVVLENDGTSWHDVTPKQAPQLSGVCSSADGHAFAVGLGGSVYASAHGERWERVSTKISIDEDLHSVWVDPEGGVWAVGGQVVSYPLVRGMMIHRGTTVPTRLVER